MFSWLKRFAAPVAAVAMLGLVPFAASAETVSFTTSGEFFVGSPAVSTGDTLNSNNDTGTASLHFDGRSISFDAALGIPVGVTLGDFDLTGSGGAVETFSGSFTLTITQSDPTGGVGNVFDTLTGTVNSTQGSTSIVFHNPIITIDGVLYAVEANPITPVGNNDPLSGTVTLTAVPVPLPATAWMGLTLLGGVGGTGAVKMLRRRREDVLA